MATKADCLRNGDLAAREIANSLTSTRRLEAAMFWEIALICGIGLAISLLLISDGLDLSIGFS